MKGGGEVEKAEEGKDEDFSEQEKEKPYERSKRKGQVAKEEADKEDIWEIPAFLRRRKRR